MNLVRLLRRSCAYLVVITLLGAAVACGSGASARRGSAGSSDRVDEQSAAEARAAAASRAEKDADRRRDVQKLEAALRARITDRRLFLMSDSVMLGAKAALPKALPTWKVNLDGKESRFFLAGLDVLRARRKEIGQVAVIQMGNNYGGSSSIFRSQIDQALAILKGVRWIVFLTVFEYRSDQAEVNNELRAAALRDHRVRIADWNAYEHQNPGHTSHDGLHLKPSGAVLMANFIASSVNSLPGA